MQDSVLPQGCGGGVAPTSSLSSLLYLSYLLSPFFFLQNPLRRFVTFSIFSSIFCLLKTFFSYQQVINNSHFSTQFFGKKIGEGVVFEVKRRGGVKLHNSLRGKEIKRKYGEINSATVASL